MTTLQQQSNVKYCEETIQMVLQANLAYIVTAKRLAEIAEKRLYFPKWGSFDEFTIDCIKESKGKVNTLMNIYRKFVVAGELPEEKVSEVGWTVLGKALPLVHSKEDAEYWLEQATEQIPSNFNRLIKEAKTGKDMSTCEHKNTYCIRICDDCKDKWEVYDLASITERDLYDVLEENDIDITLQEAKKVYAILAKKAYETEKSFQSEN